MKKSVFPLLTLAALWLFGQNLAAQKYWAGEEGDGGEGSWEDTANWSPSGLPTSTSDINFEITSTYSEKKATVSIGDGEAAAHRQFIVGLGKEVEITLGEGASYAGSYVYVGINSGTGTGVGGGSLSYLGSATGNVVSFSSFLYIGLHASGESSLSFSGENLSVSATSVIVGRRGDGNKLEVLDGAKLTLSGTLGAGSATQVDGGLVDNSVLVSGEKSTLTTTSIGLGTSTVGGSRRNRLTVDDGGSVTSAGNVNIGLASGFGGNQVEVSGGGTIRAGGTTNLRTYSTGPDEDDGRNRLVIGTGGSYLAAGNITSDNGLIQLAAGGVLNGETLTGTQQAITLTLNAGSRFEAAGTGLGASVSTIVKGNATFAVGLAGHSAAEVLTLKSRLELESGSHLELSIFGDGQYDQIALTTGGQLVLGDNVTLHLSLVGDYQPAAGSSWQLFSGDANLVTLGSNFQISQPELWDLSGFNQEGGWVIVAIPEPSTSLLLLTAVAGFCYWKRKSARGAAQQKELV